MADPGYTPDPEPLDVDNLAPTHYLILEVLAARYRLGEALWTFPSRPAIVVALDKLADLDLVGWKGGVAPKTVRVWLTETGRKAALSETYEPPGDTREWSIEVNGQVVTSYAGMVTEAQARRIAENDPDGNVTAVSRQVGPWQPAPTTDTEDRP